MPGASTAACDEAAALAAFAARTAPEELFAHNVIFLQRLCMHFTCHAGYGQGREAPNTMWPAKAPQAQHATCRLAQPVALITGLA